MEQGKITLTLAMSIDGYIADTDGGFDWIHGQGDSRLDTAAQDPFPAFLAEIDIVVMGHRCFQEGFAGDFADKLVYVAAHEKREPEGHVRFLHGDVVAQILAERNRGKRIYLFGGGILLDAFFKADVIDEYRIGIVPVILGAGRPLFLGGNPTIPLHLDRYTLHDGVFELRYTKRPD